MGTKSYSEQIAKAIASFWQTKKNQLEASGDTTNRGAVVGGKQLDAFAALIKNIAVEYGVPEGSCRTQVPDRFIRQQF